MFYVGIKKKFYVSIIGIRTDHKLLIVYTKYTSHYESVFVYSNHINFIITFLSQLENRKFFSGYKIMQTHK